MNNTNQHFGSALDNLLEETGELAEISAVAIERVESWEEDLRDPAGEIPYLKVERICS